MSSIETVEVISNGSNAFRTNVDWPELLNRVQQNETGASQDLYLLISKGILFFLRRRMPVHIAEERMHDVFMIVLKAIREGRIQEANAFPGYVRIVTKRQIFAHIRHSTNAVECTDEFIVNGLPSKATDNPESILEEQQRSKLMADVLRSMNAVSREILHRFYVSEQSQEQICAEMNLTDTQFRLLKSRAKAKFGELGRRKLAPRKPLQTETRRISDNNCAQQASV